VDITPTEPQWLLGYQARRSDGVNDRIYHRVAALDDGTKQLYLVSSELAVISPEYVAKVAARVQRELGIAPESLWWAVTHTHSAPEVGPPGLSEAFLPERYKQAATGESNPAYSRFVEEKLLEALRLGRQSLQPARVRLGVGLSMANINRRARDVDGRIRLGMNPDRPTDRQLGLLRLESREGRLIALVANYAMHGTVLGGANLKISGDAPGIVADYVEQKLGAPLVYLNGALGDVAPLYSVYPNPQAGHLGEFRALLGDRILEADRRLGAPLGEVKLKLEGCTVETPLRQGLAWPGTMREFTRAAGDGTTLIRIPVRVVGIGREAVVWSAPVELFSQIALDVRAQSRFPYTFYAGLVNGTLDYLPTAEAMAEGGYEPNTSPFSARAEQDFREAVVRLLAGMAR
jgi:hypothetical protein